MTNRGEFRLAKNAADAATLLILGDTTKNKAGPGKRLSQSKEEGAMTQAL